MSTIIFVLIAVAAAGYLLNGVWLLVGEMRSGPREPIKWVTENERINAARRDRT